MLNDILQIKTFDNYFNSKLNGSNIFWVWKVFLILVKDELAKMTGYYKLVDKLDNNNIIISALVLRIFLKVDKIIVNYQIIFFAKGQE